MKLLNEGVYCATDAIDHTDYRFEVTGKKISWRTVTGPTNFACFNFEKALELYNSTTEAAIWLVKVKEYKTTRRNKWSWCRYYSDGSRKLMMRKGLKYQKAL